jgi:hypothetical protein
MHSPNNPLPKGGPRSLAGIAILTLLLLAPATFLTGCSMTPEDKAFYGRGWINPDELDQEEPPPRAFTNPTDVEPHMMGPGEY